MVSRDKEKEDLTLVTDEVVETEAVIEEAAAEVEIEEVAEARVVETVVEVVQEDSPYP